MHRRLGKGRGSGGSAGAGQGEELRVLIPSLERNEPGTGPGSSVWVGRRGRRTSGRRSAVDPGSSKTGGGNALIDPETTVFDCFQCLRVPTVGWMHERETISAVRCPGAAGWSARWASTGG